MVANMAANAKEQFNQVLADLEVDSSDMMDNPKQFIDRVIAKSKELAKQLDARGTLSEHERTFKEKAMKNTDAKAKAEVLYEQIYELIADQDPEVLVNLMPLIADITSMMNSSIRSMSMRSGNVTTLSKRQINLLYIKLKKTYETYIQFMQFFQPEMIYKQPPVIPPKKGNYSDHSATSGIKTYQFIIDGAEWINPFPVAKLLEIEMKHYMDLPDAIRKLQPTGNEKIKGHTVKLVDISKEKEDDETE
jgi:predicted house-cleaning noncanonical NTP pyrophosphatase (MazG superfamily)